jgi:ubiquinone biosynthesis protein COQ4
MLGGMTIVMPSELPESEPVARSLEGIAGWIGGYATHVCADPVGAARELRPQLDRLLAEAGGGDEAFEAQLWASPVLRPVLERRYLPPKYEREDLAGFGPGTLGRAYHDFLVRWDLRHDYYGAMPTASAQQYLLFRSVGYHDYWHVVSGYGADPLGEIGAVSFTLGNRLTHLGEVAPRLSLQVTLTLAGAMARYALHYPHQLLDYQRLYVEGMSRGMAARSLDVVSWEEHWDRPLAAIRQELGISDRTASTSGAGA